MIIRSEEKSVIIVNGETIQIPEKFNHNNITLISQEIKVDGKITMISDQIYVDGREYINGEWKRTIKAFWHKFF